MSGRSRTPASSRAMQDDLVNEGGIMDLWVREARLFKYGSGTGTNFSSLRAEGERLSGGGKSSGLMSFLKIGDRAAGAIKSGGTTRRAAKMVIVNADHPDIEAFVDWKVRRGAEGGGAGRRLAAAPAARSAIMAACHDPASPARTGSTRARTRRCARRCGRRARRCCPRGRSSRSSSTPARATRGIEIPVYDADWDSDAYLTVSGQNSNNTVRVTDDFMRAVLEKRDWQLIRAHRRQGAQDAQGRASSGTGSATPPGPAPIPACSTTPPSTTGTPAPATGGSTRRTRAPSTCSSTTRPATWRPST